MGLMGTSGQFFAAASSSHISLLQCGSSAWATVLQDKPAPTRVHQRMQLPSEPAPFWASMDIPASTGSSVDICSTMAFSMGCRSKLQIIMISPRGCRAISSSMPGVPPLLHFHSPLLSAELFVSLVFLIPRTAVWHVALSYTFFPRSATTLAVGSALPSAGLVGAVWNCRGLARDNSGSSSQGPSTAPFATKTSPPTHKALL